MDKKQSTPDRKATLPRQRLAIFIAIVFYTAAFFGAIWLDKLRDPGMDGSLPMALVVALIGTYFLIAIRIAAQWEKAVVLRLGKFHGLKGPGLFWVVPVMDTVANWIDHRVMVTPFNAEKTLTKDTVPVDVDAVLFWMVWDAEKAALEVENYRSANTWAAQTALREVIGQMNLADILIGRTKWTPTYKRSSTSARRRGASPSNPSRSATWSSRRTWKMPCHARRRPSASARRA